MSNSITLAIKASQLKQNLPLTDAEQVVLKTKIVKEVERKEKDDEYSRRTERHSDEVR